MERECLLCRGIGEVVVNTTGTKKELRNCPMCKGKGYFTEEDKERFFDKLMRRKGMYYHG